MSSNEIQYGAIRTKPAALSVHKLLPLAALYFFFNSAALPVGLYYTSILSPLFYLWLYLQGKRWVTLKFLVCLSPFIVAHICGGIDAPFYYVRSSLLLWTAYVTTYAFCLALMQCKSLERLIDQLIVLNFCAAMVALILLFTPLSGTLWSTFFDYMEGVGYKPRLQLLASEPYVYAFLMAPLLVYSVLRLMQNPGKRNFAYAAMVAIPFVLSQSFGGLSICGAGLGLAILAMSRRVLKRRSSLLLLALIPILLAGLVLVPNPISLRVTQVVNGIDSSTQSRTNLAFMIAYAVAGSKSFWWGIGLGQSKLLDVSNLHLGFEMAIIPNAVAGAFAELGIVAVLVKFALETYLFVRMRVYDNSFKLAMFVVTFLYQLTGSHLMNVQEYLMWFFAFVTLFPALNLQTPVQAEPR